MLINGRYRVLHPLQEGGFGHTFLAEDTQLPSQRRCVVKQLKPIHDNPDFYKLIQDRFQREAAIQETLGEICPNIPRLYAYFTEGDRFFLVEEWIDGPTLTQKVAEVGRFAEAAVRDILTQVLSIIETVHQHQIIHRDIKPDNIILRKRDGQPILIDFGAVKESMGTIVDSQGVTGRSIVIGTAGFMAPEQSAGRPLYASDLYSLGLTAIYLLTAKTPAELHTDPLSGKLDWRSQAPNISNPLGRVIDTAIQMYPAERFSSAQTMNQALQTADTEIPNPFINSPTVVSRPNPPSPPSPQPAQIIPPQPNPQSAHPLAEQPTAVTRPQPITGAATQVVSPGGSTPTAIHTPPPANRQGDWIKAIGIGGGLGVVLLVGAVLLRGQPPGVVVQESPSPAPSATTTVTTSPTTSPTLSPTPATNPSPSPSPSPETPSTAADTCGDANDSGSSWYPVFINNGDLAQVQRQYCRDAIAKTRDDGTPAVQVASFSDSQRAKDFAQKVGGDVGQPYQVGASPSPTPSTSSPPSSSPVATPNDPPPGETNAVIVGNKGETNIRRGPGTNYGVQHIAYPGDRVKILGSDQDSGGFIWYKVSFPKSGATGWIAGQLLQPD